MRRSLRQDKRTSSTRRFFARPSSVSFVSLGADSPEPENVNRPGSMPWRVVSAFTTDAARRRERSRLYLSLAMLSVWPLTLSFQSGVLCA